MQEVCPAVKETNPPICWKKKTMVKDYSVNKEGNTFVPDFITDDCMIFVF